MIGDTLMWCGHQTLLVLINCLLPQQKQQRTTQTKLTTKLLLMILSRPLLLLLLLLLLSTCFVAFVPRGVVCLVQVPNRHTVASIPGDLVLGILVPVHERPSPKQAQTRTCGAVREQYGIQRVEAAFRTIDSINADPSILPNITLGIEIRDSCWHSPIALEQSIEFIRDAMAASEQQAPVPLPRVSGTGTALQQQQALASSDTSLSSSSNTSSSTTLCTPPGRSNQLSTSKRIKNLVGVVGPASSGDTVQVQNLLQLFNMPQVGYSATSRDLSNKNFFKYFLRVVPSDKLQARVLIDLMLAYNWTYITVVYTEGSYGSSLMNAFRERAQEAGICFATLESMPPNADDGKFDELIEAIQNHRNARVVICMCEGRTIGRLFAALKRRNIGNEYLVVGSDGWSDRFDVVEQQEEIALGGISIRIHSAYVHDFDDYYFQLSPFTNHRNPWFAEFWEQRFQCNLEYPTQAQTQQQLSSTTTTTTTTAAHARPAFIRPAHAKVYNRTCTGNESLRQNHKQDAKMAFVQKSIITMALGLDSMQRSMCGAHNNKRGLCAEMLPINGSIFLQHLMNVSFSFLDEHVYFDEQGDPPGKYEILNFQRKQPPTSQTVVSGPNEQDQALVNQNEHDDDDDDDDAHFLSQLEQVAMRKLHKSPNEQLQTTTTISSSASGARDSYSTLRVLRNTTSSDGIMPTGSRRRRRRQGQGQVSASSSNSDQQYSPTSDYEYVHVGSWKSSDGLRVFGSIHWPSSSVDNNNNWLGGASWSRSVPRSVCSLPCAKGHAKKIQSDSVKCCWVCVPCSAREYLFNEFKCKACEKGWWPNGDQTGCREIPIEHFDWRSLEALVAIAIALIGLALTLVTGAVFIKHNDTPVVKSSTRELSYMILFAMLLCHSNTFFLVAKPSAYTCLATRLLPGFSFAMMYGALVTKTNRIARILAGSKKKIITRRPHFMSATAQVLITWLIILIECGILVIGLVREPADRMHDYPSDQRVVLVCNTTMTGIIAPLGFDFFLIAMCTLYAFKTRNVPENFNEAKFIGFTMYTTLVIWIAFVVIYFSSDHKVTTLSLCISFSAHIALYLLFFPRCYIIIFKPEKNNRSYFTTIKNIRCHIGYQLATSGGGGGGGSGTSHTHSSTTANNNIFSIGGGQLNDATTISTTNKQQQNLAFQFACNQLSALHSKEQQQQQQNNQSKEFNDDTPPRNGRTKQVASASFRSRTSGRRVAPEAQTNATNDDTFAKPASLVVDNIDDDDADADESQHRREQARAQQFELLCGDDKYWLGDTTITTSHQYEQPKHQQRQGVVVAAAESGGGGQQTGTTSWRHLFGTIRAAFARRSRRKESDKSAVIQQHLRAIRHAENLDRQTHFRRSQVQRLAQRFDSSAAFNWSLEHHMKRDDGVQFDAWARGDEAQKLLGAMSQLIGFESVWQLARIVSNYCAQNDQQPAAAVPNLNMANQPPLNLRRLADRRLALAWLRLLAQLAHKSAESVQIVIAGPTPFHRLTTAGRPFVSLSAQQSRDSIQLATSAGELVASVATANAAAETEDDDPIKRALDRIAGKTSARTKTRTSDEKELANDDDHETQLKVCADGRLELLHDAHHTTTTTTSQSIDLTRRCDACVAHETHRRHRRRALRTTQVNNVAKDGCRCCCCCRGQQAASGQRRREHQTSPNNNKQQQRRQRPLSATS